MGLLGEIAQEQLVREIRRLIEKKISENKDNLKLVEVLKSLEREILDLLPAELQ